MSRFQSLKCHSMASCPSPIARGFAWHSIRYRWLMSRSRRLFPALCVVGMVLLSSCSKTPTYEGVAAGSPGGPLLPVPPSTSGSAAGDLLVAVVGVEVNPATNFPGGWTAVAGHDGFNGATCTSDGDPPGINCQLSVYWKISNGTETSVNVTFGPGTHHAAGAVLRYSRFNATNPIGAVNSQDGTGNPVAPTITTAQDDTRVIRVVVGDTNPGAGGDTQTPLLSGPENERFSVQSSTPQVNARTVQVAGSGRGQRTAGPSGTATWTGGGGNWVASSIAIRPVE